MRSASVYLSGRLQAISYEMNFTNAGDESYGSDARLSIMYTPSSGGPSTTLACFGGYDSPGIPWSFVGVGSKRSGMYSDRYKDVSSTLQTTGLWQLMLLNDWVMSQKASYDNVRVGLYGSPIIILISPTPGMDAETAGF